MKTYEWRGKDVWLCENGAWKHVCQALGSVSSIEIAEALNEREVAKAIKRHNDDRCARYKARNKQIPPKKKVDY